MTDPKAARGVIVSARGLEAALVLPNAESASLCVYESNREVARAPMKRDAAASCAGLRPASAPARATASASRALMSRSGDAASTRRNCWPILTPGGSTSRSASIPRCSPSARTRGRTRPRRSPGLPPAGEPGRRRIAPEALIIYELNLRGFSRLNPAIPEAARGTFAGLAHPASIAHLTALGVTAVEIMPADTFVDERHMPALGLADAWGYNAVVFGSPDPRLAPGGWAEVRAATDALHAAGMEAILDVVFNHNGESDQLGPTLSFRGLDNEAWFRLDPRNPALYINDAGTGNCLALDRPLVIEMAIGALRRWMVHGGFDGFRFDLATALGRRADGLRPARAILSRARRRSPP